MPSKHAIISIVFIISLLIVSTFAFLALSYTKEDTAKVENTLFIDPGEYVMKKDTIYWVKAYSRSLYKTDIEGKTMWKYSVPWDNYIEDFTIADYVYVASEKAIYILNNSGILAKKVAFSSLVNSTNDSLYWPIILWSYKNNSYLHLNQHVYFLNGTGISNIGNFTMPEEPYQKIMFGEDTLMAFKFRNHTSVLDFHKDKMLWSMDISGHFFVKYPYIVEYNQREMWVYKNNSLVFKTRENNHKILGVYCSQNRIIGGLVRYPYTRRSINQLIINVYDLQGRKIANGTIDISPELTRDLKVISFYQQNDTFCILAGHSFYITTIPEKINENLHWEKYSLKYNNEIFIECNKNVLITHTSTDDNYVQIITFYTIYRGYNYKWTYDMEYKDFLILGTIVAIPVGLGIIGRFARKERLNKLKK